jgi:hypothetical protein
MGEGPMPGLLGTDGNRMGSQEPGLNSSTATTFGSWIGPEQSNGPHRSVALVVNLVRL